MGDDKTADLTLLAQLKAWFSLVFSAKGCWVFLPGILGVSFVYIANWRGWEGAIAKDPHETLAIILLVIATSIFAFRVVAFRFPLDKILLALSAALLCREIHFAGTKKGIYVAVVLIIIWAIFWRGRYFEGLRVPDLFKVSCFGLFWTYIFSQIIARRAFRGILPLEEELHVPFEEIVENIAHVFFIYVGLLSFVIKRKAEGPGNGSVAEGE